ncbi:MAG: Rrf2 family transcriptional regulator [Thermoguttaceae bacterium]|jgi:Rrf2 family protein
MLSKTALHALRAMTVLAELPEKSFAGAVDIAKAIHAPRNYLGKLLQSLAEAGLVESQKGKGGGFRLARQPAAITVFDVVEPIDHVGRWRGCFMGRSECSCENSCVVHSRWQAVRDAYLAFLQDTTLADLAQQPASQLLLT